MFRLAMILTLPLFSPASADDALQGDLARIQGRWEGTFAGGGEIAIEIKGDAVTATFPNDADAEITMRGRLRIDEAKGTMDWTGLRVIGEVAKGEKVPDFLGIYTIEGGELVYCGDAQRPKEFDEELTVRYRRAGRR